MATKLIRVDTEVTLELAKRSNGRTPNQVIRELLGLQELPYPHGGASRVHPVKTSIHIGRAERYLVKAFQELRKTRRAGA